VFAGKYGTDTRYAQTKTTIKLSNRFTKMLYSNHRREIYNDEIQLNEHRGSVIDHGICLLGPERDLVGRFHTQRDDHQCCCIL